MLGAACLFASATTVALFETEVAAVFAAADA